MSFQDCAVLKESSFGAIRTTGPYFACRECMMKGWRPRRNQYEYGALLQAASGGPGYLYRGCLM
jgi:hypothetical protein